MKSGSNNVIGKITRLIQSSDKKRNFFVTAAITLTTLMIASVFSIGISLYESAITQQIRFAGSKSHAAFPFATPKQIELLKSLDYVKSIGTGNYAALVESEGLSMAYIDEKLYKEIHVPAWTNIVGHYPKECNEIMVSRWILEKLGIENPKIGMTIPLSYTTDDESTTHNEVFVLSGYYTEYNHLRSKEYNLLLVSKEFSDKYGKTVENDGSVNIVFTDTKNITQYIEKLKIDLELSDNQPVVVSPIYQVKLSEQASTVAAFALIILFIIFAAFLLIYNVLYISVSKDIRFYGLLKAIGATPKQLRQIVIKLVMRLCIIGIPIGALLAGFLSIALVNVIASGSGIETGAVISFSPLIYVGAAFFSLLTAYIGAYGPAKTASNTSAIEAVRFSEGEASISKKKIYSPVKGKLYKMAFRNIFRSKKRTFIVFLSLFFSLTIFITAITLVSSMDIDKYASYSLPNDFCLQNNAIIAFKQTFTGEHLDKLSKIPGFKKMHVVRVGFGAITYTPSFEPVVEWLIQSFSKYGTTYTKEDISSSLGGIIIGVDAEMLAEINSSLSKPVDLQKFEQGDFALIVAQDPDIYTGVTEIEITLSPSEATVLNIPVGGFVPHTFRYALQSISTVGPSFLVSNKVLENLDEPLIQSVNIDVAQGYDEQAAQAIKEITGGDNDISIESRLKLRQDIKDAKTILYILGGGISLILGLTGIFNFINVMSVGINVRKREIAVLESIGMSNKQTRKMLVYEGAGYALITLALTGVLGNGIAYAVFVLVKRQAEYAIFDYPFYPVLAAAIIIMAICIITPDIVYRPFSKLGIAEKLRDTDY